MILRSYLVYWWQLGLARLSNWSLSHSLVPPQLLGYSHAKLDVSHDILKIYYCGLKPLWYQDTEITLRNDYQIEYLNLNHLDHSEWHASFENAYNKVAMRAIREKFGMDVVDLCLTKAEMEYRTQQVQISA